MKRTLYARACRLSLAATLVASIAVSATASAAVVFSDDFSTGANPAWGNERGSWRAVDGTYDAAAPSNSPFTYSSVTTLPSLTDFTAFVTANDVNDGGVWLHSSFNGGATNGILLVTGGFSGTSNSVYFHEVHNNSQGAILSLVTVPGLQGSTVDLRIVVSGNTYSVFFDGNSTPVTTLVNSAFPSGSFGLYDFSPITGSPLPRGQTFDNVSLDVSAITPAPEPTSLILLVSGLTALAFARRRTRIR